MRNPNPRVDLVAFVSVLLTGVVLIACKVRPEAVSTVALGLSTLYAAWRRPSTENHRTGSTDHKTSQDTKHGGTLEPGVTMPAESRKLLTAPSKDAGTPPAGPRLRTSRREVHAEGDSVGGVCNCSVPE